MHDLYFEDFEFDNGNWTRQGQKDQTTWRWMADSVREGEFGWHVGRAVNNQPAGYDAEADVNITSPAIDLTGKRLLKVQFNAHGNSADNDLLRLLIRENGSTGPWSQLTSVSGFSQTYSGRYGALVSLSDQNLAAYDGKTVQLRFRFTSDANRDQGDVAQGWFIDDVRLIGTNRSVVENPDEGHDPTIPKEYIDFDMCRTESVRAAEGDRMDVDLVEDQGKYIRFRVLYDNCEAAFPGIYLIGIQLNHSGKERVNLILEHVGHDNTFVGEVAMNYRDLVVGNWNITAYAFADSTQPGKPLRYMLEHRSMSVTAETAQRDVDVWLVGHENQERTPKQRMGPGSQLRFLVDHDQHWPQLQKVTYQLHIIEGDRDPKRLRAGPELELKAPYVIDVGILGTEGEQVLFIRGYDRGAPTLDTDVITVDESSSVAGAGVKVHRNVTLLRVPMVVDKSKPVVDFWFENQTLYQDVPFKVFVNVSEPYSPDYHLRVLLQSQLFGDVIGRAPGENHTFTVVANRTGPMSLFAVATDGVNLTTQVEHPIIVRLRDADTSVTGLRFLDDLDARALLIGNQIRLEANLTQHNGLGPVEINATATGPDLSLRRALQLPSDGSTLFTFPYNLTRAGTVTARVNGTLDLIYNETTPANQESALTFEVYLGRTDLPDKSFLIEANARGQPKTALLHGTEDRFPLQLRDIRADPPCNGAVYTFEVGQDLYCWNPFQREATPRPIGVTTLDGPITVEDDEPTTKGLPGPSLVSLLGAVAVMLAIRRRSN